MIYVFDTQSSKNSFEVFSFRKCVHHVHNCWLRSHIEFWILKPTSLDLQLMTFGPKTLMLGCKNQSFWDAKSMILGSEIDLGASQGDLWPILAPRSSLGGILEPITNFRTAFGITFWSPKTIQINEKNLKTYEIFEMGCWLDFRWILVPTWAQLGPPNPLQIGSKSVQEPSQAQPKSHSIFDSFFNRFFIDF